LLTWIHNYKTGCLNRNIIDAIEQNARLIQQSLGDQEFCISDNYEAAITRSIAAGYWDRLCKRRGRGEASGRMVGGRGVRLSQHSGVRESEYFVAIDVDDRDQEAIVHVASEVRREWIPLEQTERNIETFYNSKTDRLEAKCRVRFGDLILEEYPSELPADAYITLIAQADQKLHELLPSPDSPSGQWIARVTLINTYAPELNLPKYNDDYLKRLAYNVAVSCRSRREIREANWEQHLKNDLSWEQCQIIEREAPSCMVVPSGSIIPLQYDKEQPILAVRVQELFGWHETPCLVLGRVKVLFHILAPNYRPQQITSDLESFWTNGYPILRKELRGRYPKHSWPEDPRTAEATRGVKRRS
jgi:ATP-dependent helicase HrpB